jgi:hypothetical protein
MGVNHDLLPRFHSVYGMAARVCSLVLSHSLFESNDREEQGRKSRGEGKLTASNSLTWLQSFIIFKVPAEEGKRPL